MPHPVTRVSEMQDLDSYYHVPLSIYPPIHGAGACPRLSGLSLPAPKSLVPTRPNTSALTETPCISGFLPLALLRESESRLPSLTDSPMKELFYRAQDNGARTLKREHIEKGWLQPPADSRAVGAALGLQRVPLTRNPRLDIRSKYTERNSHRPSCNSRLRHERHYTDK